MLFTKSAYVSLTRGINRYSNFPVRKSSTLSFEGISHHQNSPESDMDLIDTRKDRKSTRRFPDLLVTKSLACGTYVLTEPSMDFSANISMNMFSVFYNASTPKHRQWKNHKLAEYAEKMLSIQSRDQSMTALQRLTGTVNNFSQFKLPVHQIIDRSRI